MENNKSKNIIQSNVIALVAWPGWLGWCALVVKEGFWTFVSSSD